MTRTTALLVVTCITALAALMLLGRELAASRGDSTRVAAALERIEARQSEQAERLARLESRPVVAQAAPVAAARAAGIAARTSAPRLSAADVQRRFEARFVSEPLASAWATQHEAVVATFLDTRNLAKLQLDAPRDHAVDCRSRTCRIELVFDDADVGAPTQERLVMAIGDTLPSAQIFTNPRRDGRVEIVIFAGDRDALSF